MTPPTYKVRFMTLEGKFALLKSASFPSFEKVKEAVEAHAASGGFTNVKLADDPEDPDTFRFTARTPKGRNGRNIAFADEHFEDEDG